MHHAFFDLVAADRRAADRLRQLMGEYGFARSGGPADHDERGRGHVHIVASTVPRVVGRDTGAMDRVVTSYSTLEWSTDASLVTKTRSPAFDARRRYRNELRINRLLNVHPPPVTRPTLLAHDVHHRQPTFVAVAGQPLGPKYPLELTTADIDTVIDIAHRLRTFNPRGRWFRRLDSARRLTLARRAGLLADAQASRLIGLANRVHTRLRFGHGDLTARNVLESSDGATLIDWEWAGLYPDGYELAFFCFSLVDVENGRALVEAHVDADPRAFLLSALLIQLWHLHWYVPIEFRERRPGPGGQRPRSLDFPEEPSAGICQDLRDDRDDVDGGTELETSGTSPLESSAEPGPPQRERLAVAADGHGVLDEQPLDPWHLGPHELEEPYVLDWVTRQGQPGEERRWAQQVEVATEP